MHAKFKKKYELAIHMTFFTNPTQLSNEEFKKFEFKNSKRR